MSIVALHKPIGPIPPSLNVLPSIIARILVRRGVTHMNEMDTSLSSLEPPDKMPNIHLAAGFISDAIMERQSILIIGDFDADGATSSAVMYRALNMMGAVNVKYAVPDRKKHGYGMSVSLIDDWLSENDKPDLIVTVDNGTTAFDGIKHARSMGIKVVVTDHHLPGDTLPETEAIVNPNLDGSEFGSKSMAGVGVSFYVMAATRSELRKRDWFSERTPAPNLSTLLDLVALGLSLIHI